MGKTDWIGAGEGAHKRREEAAVKPIWVTVAEAIRLTSIRRTCLYARIADGTIRSTRLGGKRLISYASIEELGDAAKRGATTVRAGERE